MIEWGFVPLHHIIDELKELAPRHHEEVFDGEPLNIDWDTYTAAGKSGQACAVTARDGGKLIGYVAFTISRNLRHMHLIEATSSGWYVEKEYRGHLGIEMVKKADDFLSNSGIHKTEYILNGAAGKLLERHGYKSTYQVWSINHG